MKKRTYFILLPIFILIFISSCVVENTATCHKYIILKNNSDKDIYYVMASRRDYLPTSPSGSSNEFLLKKGEEVEIYSDIHHRGCFETSFNSWERGNKYLHIIDADLIDTTIWDEIVERNLFLKVYELSKDFLSKTDGTITYP